MTDYVSQTDVGINESFFSRLMNTAADRILPYQWEALNDRVPGADPSYCIRNFRAAAGLENAPHGGWVFQDTDLAKWLEAASYMLMWRKDPETEKRMDEAIELIGNAQQPDGYLDTYYILTGIDKRWTNVRDNHELYCAGHMLEAAVAYYRATGKRSLLEIMIRFVDHIDSVFGPEEGKKHGYPGHEEIELALIKLYEVTKDPKHLALAKYFIDERGKDGGAFFNEEAAARGAGIGWANSVYEGNHYFQAGKPVREQKHALGHAVRQMYLLSGMADTARETNDESLKEACREMWKDITRRQMYITGALGQTSFGEAFTFDYDLPNDTVYGETCASIAMVFFAHRMLRMEPKGEYGDVMDTMLYNGTISGMNLNGDRFFYVNPLESCPERSERSQIISHIRPERRKWFGCACCPPNLARMICSLPGYVLLKDANRVYMNLFTCCDVKTDVSSFSVKTGYPYDGEVCVSVKTAEKGFELALRKPGWCKNWTLTVNGKAAETEMADGFIVIRGLKSGDELVYRMDMSVRVVRANPRVRADAGKAAVCRGPVVYCLEEIDNGANLSAVRMPEGTSFEVKDEPELLGGVKTIEALLARQDTSVWDDDALYSDDIKTAYRPFTARFVPYYAWNNRGRGEMTVWVMEK